MGCPADGRLLALELDDETVIPVKGCRFTLSGLVGDPQLARRFAGGTCLIFRLAPSDFHRFAYVETGHCGPIHRLGGTHYSVNPLALRLALPVFTENYREYCLIETQTLGTVVQMEVGSFSVGRIVQRRSSDGPCRRGEEKGWFEFGASTVVVLVGPGRLSIDEDIRSQSARKVETLVRLGEAIATVNALCREGEQR